MTDSPTPTRDDEDSASKDQQALRTAVARDAERLEQAERDRASILRYAVTLGAVAGLFIVPVVAGAYLGRWLDESSPGYSARWTVSGILIGLGIGAWNVYRYIREHW
jgi:ATP synthase protein I